MNIKFCRIFTFFALKTNNADKSRAMKDTMREIDAQTCENQHAKTKLKENCNVYSIKAINVFEKTKVMTAMIKCAHRLN